jgi:hypothetical protein
MATVTHEFAHKLEATRWGIAVEAAFIAGLVFLALQMFAFWAFFGQSPIAPARSVAAIVSGPEVLQGAGFDFGVLVVAAAVHFGLSILFAWVLTPLIQDMSIGRGVAVGLGFGLLLFIVNFFVMAALFPWFAEGRNWVTLINHLIFGAVLAYSYLRLRYRH